MLLATLLQYDCRHGRSYRGRSHLAAVTGFAHPDRADLPMMAAYLMLGSAMFLALLLQTVRIRAVPLLVAMAGLAAELALHDRGMVVQVVTPAVLLVVIGGYAFGSLGSAVRHG